MKTIVLDNLAKVSLTFQDGMYVLVIEENKETYKLVMTRAMAINVFDELDDFLDYDLLLAKKKKNTQRRKRYLNGKA